MLKVLKVNAGNADIVNQNFEKIYEVEHTKEVYFVDAKHWQELQLKKQLITTASAQIIEKFITNRDDVVDKLIKFSYMQNNSILSKLLTLTHNYDSSIITPEQMLDAMIEDKFLIDRVLETIQLGEEQQHEVQEATKDETIKQLKEELMSIKQQSEQAITKLVSDKKELIEKLKLLASKLMAVEEANTTNINALQKQLAEKTELADELQNKLNECMNKNFKTDEQSYKKPLILEKDMHSVIPYTVNTTELEMERVKIGDMEISVPKQYKEELMSHVQNNPAYILEFVLTKLPHLVPIIYAHYEQ